MFLCFVIPPVLYHSAPLFHGASIVLAVFRCSGGVLWKAVTDLCTKQIPSTIVFMCFFHLFMCSFYSVCSLFIWLCVLFIPLCDYFIRLCALFIWLCALFIPLCSLSIIRSFYALFLYALFMCSFYALFLACQDCRSFIIANAFQ